MVSRFAAFVIWAAVAASIVFWALRLGARPIAVPAHATPVTLAGGFNGDMGRVLGADLPAAVASMAPAAVQEDARFKLIGVVAPRSAGAQAEGVALIATNGKPARAYRVGTAVDGELVLLAVHARGASLGPRGQPAQVDLQLPALPLPSTGTMPGSVPPPRLPPLPPPPAAPQALPQPQFVVPPDVAPEPEPGERPMGMRPPA